MHKSIIEKYSDTKKPLLLDGAIGALIQKQIPIANDRLWSSVANFSNPELVLGIHRNYLSAGADILTTNTFRTNPVAVSEANYDFTSAQLVNMSVNIAKEAIYDGNALIAGSNAPAEDCYQAERRITHNKLELNHRKHIEFLWENNVDFILNETQSHLDEIDIICKFCSSNKIPFVVSLYFTKDLKILSGEPINEVVELIKSFNPLAVSFNCINLSSFNSLDKSTFRNYLYGFYLNLGSEDIESNLHTVVSPNQYQQIVKQNLQDNTLFVGACCGSDFRHIAKIRELIDEIY